MKQIRKTKLERLLEEGVLKELNAALRDPRGPKYRVEVRRASSSGVSPARAAYDVIVSWNGQPELKIRVQVTINEVKIFLEGALAFMPSVCL